MIDLKKKSFVDETVIQVCLYQFFSRLGKRKDTKANMSLKTNGKTVNEQMVHVLCAFYITNQAFFGGF